MKLSSFKRLITQDFPKESQKLIEQLGSTLNTSISDIYMALNRRLTFSENIACTVKDINVIVDSNGNPTQVTSFTVDVPDMKVLGVIVVQATNLDNSAIYPTSAPWISYQIGTNQVRINNIKGLTPNQTWRLKVIAIN